jgi:hypothetical protein
MKQYFRKPLLAMLDLIASDIRDYRTGERLGRGLLLPWGGGIHLAGYEGKPLIPRFEPQGRLCFWKQKIGFTAHPAPDFSSMASERDSGSATGTKVLNLIITHRGWAHVKELLGRWSGCSLEENLWLVFGGNKVDFDHIDYPRKVFIDDPELRTRDHQREKQSYAGLLRACAPIVEREGADYVYLCEYDHLPAVPDLSVRQIRALREEGADVMAHCLIRTDGTNWVIALAHESDPQFHPFWKSVSVREDSSVILWMFGSGSFWTREAFLAVALKRLDIACYFEIHLPTMAHHLGFRVRNWNPCDHLLTNLPKKGVTLEVAMSQGCWTVHPVKEP